MTILITGGSSGLGAAITKLCCETFPDAHIFFTYNSSHTNAMNVEKEYINAKSIKCNFKNENSVKSICCFIQENSIDILINNAFVGLEQTHFHKISHDTFSQSFTENVIPVLKITQSFIIAARKRKSGKIITVLSSAICNLPQLGMSLYIAEKNYLLSMHRSWAVENASFKITSNCVSPGFMLTPLQSTLDERIVENLISQHPLKALLPPSIVAETIVTLITSNNYVNGQNIIINSSLSA